MPLLASLSSLSYHRIRLPETKVELGSYRNESSRTCMRFARAGEGSAVVCVCVADFNRVQEVHRDREEDARRDPGSAAEDECYNGLAQTVGKESQGCVVGTHGCCGLAGSLRVRTGCRRCARTRPRMTRPAPGRSWRHRAINCSPLCPRVTVCAPSSWACRGWWGHAKR